MENSLKGLILAAGVAITCIVISLGFFIAREARDTASNGTGKIQKLNAEFNESDKVLYDGLQVSGSEVMNVVGKFQNEQLSIKVVTKKSSQYYGYSMSGSDTMLGTACSSSTSEAQSVTSTKYINPNAQFVGSICRDSNDTVIGIVFTQV
ncbi:MAG: hypothetical protein PUB10_07910 [Clostridiales bacterium]|nr:hypothetical protein [Clostridiales bacterium]